MATRVTCDWHEQGERKASWLVKTVAIRGNELSAVHSSDVCSALACMEKAVKDALSTGVRKSGLDGRRFARIELVHSSSRVD